MKEKSFDHIENKIREAADNSEPDFDEQGWQKMELLLDQDNDRRRPLGWLFFVVIIAALVSGYFMFGNERAASNAAPGQVAALSIKQTDNATIAHNINADTDNISSPKNTPAINSGAQSFTPSPTSTANNIFSGKHSINNTRSAAQNKFVSDINNYNVNGDANANTFTSRKKIIQKGKTTAAISGGTTIDDLDNTTEAITTTEISIDPQAKSATAILQKNDVGKSLNKQLLKDTAAEKKTVATDTKPATEKNKQRKASRFYLLGSVGAEASSVKIFSLNNSAVVAKYGLGAGYRLSNRWSVQTGFNVSRKKYIAGPGDYNPKAGSYWAMVEIKKVDANCLVYEIPLAFRYNVFQRKNTTLYATAGVSSFIMKKEDYKYSYISNYQQHEGKLDVHRKQKSVFNSNVICGN